MRTFLIVSLICLSGCNTVPKEPSAQHIDQSVPKKVNPALCGPIEEAPKVQGGIILPSTQAEHDAIQMFLNGEVDLYLWGGRGWKRAAIAKKDYCKGE